MKPFFFVFTVLALSGCRGLNEDGSSKFTYSSCQITASEAPHLIDQQHDLQQCWNTPGLGIFEQSEAILWCEERINAYVEKRYTTIHTIYYSISTKNCVF